MRVDEQVYVYLVLKGFKQIMQDIAKFLDSQLEDITGRAGQSDLEKGPVVAPPLVCLKDLVGETLLPFGDFRR